VWPFSKKEAGVQESFVVPAGNTNRPAYDYDKYAREAYQLNSTAATCIKCLGRAIAGLPLKVYRMQGGEERLLPDHKVWQFFKRPDNFKYKSWEKLQVGNLAYMHLNGNSYHYITGVRGYPQHLTLLRPDRVTIKLNDAATEISHYEYRTGSREPIRYDPESILHVATFSPLNDLYGEPILNAATWGLDSDNMAQAWNVSVLKNLGAPSMLLEAPEHAKMMTPQQIKQMRSQFAERYQGYKNAGKPIALAGGYKPHVISWSAKDLDWLAGMVSAQVRIAIVCGVPPELVGIQGQKTYANYKEARRAFYIDTVIPTTKIYLGELVPFLNHWFNDEFEIGIDEDKIDALQEDTNDRWTRVDKSRQGGILTTNEARELLGFDPIPGGDSILVNANLLPLDVVGSFSEIQPAKKPMGGTEE